jgi:hypothetical protein
MARRFGRIHLHWGGASVPNPPNATRKTGTETVGEAEKPSAPSTSGASLVLFSYNLRILLSLSPTHTLAFLCCAAILSFYIAFTTFATASASPLNLLSSQSFSSEHLKLFLSASPPIITSPRKRLNTSPVHLIHLTVQDCIYEYLKE